MFKSWKEARTRGRWLRNGSLTISKATPNKSLRIAWGDGKTRVDVELYPKGEGKTQVSVQHSKLASAAAAAKQNAYSRQALERLTDVVEN